MSRAAGRSWSLTDLPKWARRSGRMSLNDTILSSVVRIIGDKHYEDAPGSYRGVIGTGFLCAVPSRSVPNARYGYVITAHHVIADQDAPEVQAPTPNSGGAALQEPVELIDWKQPVEDVDIAIADLHGGVGGMYGGLVTERHLFPMGRYPSLGSVAHYVGVLEPEDRVMVRSGSIGALYQSGLEHPGGYVYDAHLLDCRSYEGFSGSPCFAEVPMARLEASDTVFPGDKFQTNPGPRGPIEYHALLCGMITWHLGHHRQQHASLYGVVAAVTSEDIWRVLMSEKEQQERDEADRKHLAEQEANGPKPINLSASGGAKEDEFERFEDLTRYLANTPKPEKAGDS